MFRSILVVSTNAFCTVLSHFQSELFWASSYLGSGLLHVEHKANLLCHLPLFSIADDVNEALPVLRVRPELPSADHVFLPQASKCGACNLKSQMSSDLLESPIPCFLLAIRTVLHARQTTNIAAFFSLFSSVTKPEEMPQCGHTYRMVKKLASVSENIHSALEISASPETVPQHLKMMGVIGPPSSHMFAIHAMTLLLSFSVDP